MMGPLPKPPSSRITIRFLYLAFKPNTLKAASSITLKFSSEAEPVLPGKTC